MSTALYRLYRPQKFSEVEGQPSAVNVLVKSISTGRTAHAYLFSGARGCGKTTVARLVAKALNCVSPKDGYEPCCECVNCVSVANGDNLDVVEIDGASNNGVEEIRELKSHVSLAPFSSRFKIYIIDEVHMLSTAAFNALLKTLEEPPEYVVFILATTEPHKIPVTIRSRCQHIPFHRISSADILRRLEFVCAKEGLEYEGEALWEIARQADGALRDALSLLDQVMAYGKGKILLDDVSALMGGGSVVSLQRWLSAWREGSAESFVTLNDMFQRGASPQRTIEELFDISKNLWAAGAFGPEALSGADISKEEYDYAAGEHKLWSQDALERLMLFFAKLLPQARAGMRTSVLVGVLMSRRQSILTGAGAGEAGSYDKAERAPKRDGQSPRAADQPSPDSHGAADSGMAGSGAPAKARSESGLSQPPTEERTSGETVSSGKASSDGEAKPGGKAGSARSVVPAEKISPAPAPFQPEDEGFSRLSDETRGKLLLSLKSNDFALFCATLDADFFYNAEKNAVCAAVKHEYAFHFLSGGRNSLALVRTVREEYPEGKLVIAFGDKRGEFGGAASADKKTKGTAEPKPKTLPAESGAFPAEPVEPGAIPAESAAAKPASFPANTPTDYPSEPAAFPAESADFPPEPAIFPADPHALAPEGIGFAQSGLSGGASGVYDAAYSAMKYMRGEIVLFHTVKDSTSEDFDILYRETGD